MPIINATTEAEAMQAINSNEAGLAMGQKITVEDRADILTFALCGNMFKLVKDVLNFKGIYVNVKKDSVEKFVDMFGNWKGIESISKLLNMWQNWEQLTFDWQDIVQTGKAFLNVYEQADRLFGN